MDLRITKTTEPGPGKTIGPPGAGQENVFLSCPRRRATRQAGWHSAVRLGKTREGLSMLFTPPFLRSILQ